MSLTKDMLKALLVKIKDNSTATDDGADAFSEALVSLESEANDTMTKLSVATTEAITRKKKLRTMESDMEDVTLDRDKFKEQAEKGIDNTELDALKAFKTKAVAGQVKSFGTTLGTIKEHANFEKAKALFTLPEPDAEGNYDVSKMSEDDLEKNVEKLNELEGLDYFGATTGKVDVDGNKQKTTPKGFDDSVNEAKSLEELQAIQDGL